MNKKILGLSVAFLFVVMLIAPVMAIGPGNAEGKNPNLVIIREGINTQMWLPSGVMNEWINYPTYPGLLRVMLKDAAKFQIKNAYEITDPAMAMMPLMNENKWFYLTEEVFVTFLLNLGYDPAIVDTIDFPNGLYIKLIYVRDTA